MNTLNIKPIGTITAIDPDTGGEVDLVIYKTASGAMVALEQSFIEQGEGCLYSPYDAERLVLVDPDDCPDEWIGTTCTEADGV